MKRIVASLLCISLIFTQYKQAEAAVPVVVAGVAAGAVLLLAAGAIQYYSNPSSSAGVVSAAQNVYTNATAYTNGVSAVGQSLLYSEAVKLKTSAAAIYNAVKDAADGTYPFLKSLFSTTPPPKDQYSPGAVPQSGDYIKLKDGTSLVLSGNRTIYDSDHTVVSADSHYKYGPYIYVSVPKAGYPVPYVVSGGVAINRVTTYRFDASLPAPPPALIPESGAANALAGQNPGNPLPISSPVPSAAIPEINNMIASGAVTAVPVSDALPGVEETAPPYVPVLPAGTTATGTVPTTTTGLGSGTTTAAEQNVTTATQTVTGIQTQLAADPTNAALQQQLAAAQSALAAAQAALDQAKAAENEVYVNPMTQPRKALNLESWRQLVDVLPSKFPFNLVTTLGSYFEPFLAAPAAPSFELHIYQDKKIDIDLSVFDTPVAIFRWGLALLLTFGMLQFLIRWWKGTA